MIREAITGSPVLLLAVILFAAGLFGGLAERLRVPWITGCIFAGILLGPDAADLLPRSAQAVLAPFLQVSLALIAFNIGTSLAWSRLRQTGASIVLLAAAQLLAPLVLVGAVLLLAGLAWPVALIAAAASPVTAPTTTYAVIRRRKASGPFVDRALAILALNDAAGILLFSVLSAIAVAALAVQEVAAAGPATPLWHALGREGLSLLLGGLLGGVYLVALRLFSAERPGAADRARVLLYAVLLAAAGAAIAFGLSHLLTPLALGAVVANGSGEAEPAEAKAAIAMVEPPFYMVFFVLAGAHLPVNDLGRMAMLAAGLGYVLARLAGKWTSVWLTARALGLDRGTRRYLGLCFPSQGGAAMGLVLACAASPAVLALGAGGRAAVDMAENIVLLGVLLSQLFGPMVIDYAVSRGAPAPAPQAAGSKASATPLMQ